MTAACVAQSSEGKTLTAAMLSNTNMPLSFMLADNESTLALLRNAARLPALRRLGVWDHEEADEYLELTPQLLPGRLRQQLRRRELQLQPAAAAAVRDGEGQAQPPPQQPQQEPQEQGAEQEVGKEKADNQEQEGHADEEGEGEGEGEPEGPAEVEVLCYPRVETLELKATTPEFFDEFLLLLRAGALRFGSASDDGSGGCGGGAGGSGSSTHGSGTHGSGSGSSSGSSSGNGSGSSSGLRTVRLDACYDPPLLQPGRLGQLLLTLGPGLVRAVVSGWATPGSEAALLSLAKRVGRHPGLCMEYEYPIL